MSKYEQYLDYGAPLHEPVRHGYCPFCETYRNAFVVTRTERGFLMWCHRCHAKKYVKSKTPSLAETLRVVKARATASLHPQQERVPGAVPLPDDFVADIPQSGLVWLAMYGVTSAEIQQYRFGYSPSKERLILPVFNDNVLMFWQGRYLGVDSNQPKYLSVRTARADIWFECGPDDSTKCVLVEDILSALAVARAGYRAVALLGSYVNDALLKKLLREGRQVCVWLDPDKRAESIRYSKRLRAFGLQAASILRPDKDPKEYPPNRVTEYLEGEKHAGSSDSADAQDVEDVLECCCRVAECSQASAPAS